MTAGTIIVGGSVAQRPGRGGHTWVFLQYLLGFRALGWDVLLLDRLEPEMCRDAQGNPCDVDGSENLRYFQRVLDQFDLADSYALLCDGGTRCLGMERQELIRRVGDAAMLLNVNGFIDDPDVMDKARLRVFLDIDPGFGQMWHELGLGNIFSGHDVFVTIGENIGKQECRIPTCGLEWITTPQPVVLEQWPATGSSTSSPHRSSHGSSHRFLGDRFTTVASWRGPFGPIEYQGDTYGLRVHEWRKFASLPTLCEQSFEVALDIDESDRADRTLLERNGWRLVDPGVVAGDPSSYRDYVQGSMAELMVAKNMYVRAGSGWFSDRSVCYLASGRPVLAQDTGIGRLYPTGVGLLTFTTLDEAVAGAEEIAGEYPRHARRARELAQEHFESGRVLSRLLALVGIA